VTELACVTAAQIRELSSEARADLKISAPLDDKKLSKHVLLKEDVLAQEPKKELMFEALETI
jgi:hypothetical protein